MSARCLLCGLDGPIVARGLCDRCYSHQHYIGRLDDWPLTKRTKGTKRSPRRSPCTNCGIICRSVRSLCADCQQLPGPDELALTGGRWVMRRWGFWTWEPDSMTAEKTRPARENQEAA